MKQRAIYPHEKIKEYSSFASDIDLVADSPDEESPARAIFVVTAGSGSLAVTFDSGDTETITGLTDNDYVHPTPCYFKSIQASGTDVTKIRVAW